MEQLRFIMCNNLAYMDFLLFLLQEISNIIIIIMGPKQSAILSDGSDDGAFWPEPED